MPDELGNNVIECKIYKNKDVWKHFMQNSEEDYEE